MSPEKLLSQSDDLPLYAEAAPNEFLRIIEEDLQSPGPQVYGLMKPTDTGLFGGGCPRTGLLWALETLAWKPEQLLRVSLILAKLAEQKITDNWSNKPENCLLSIFRSWMPQTAASLDQRKKALETLTKRFPLVGWQVCLPEFFAGSQTGDYSHRPRWRNDASGAGQPITRQEANRFRRKALDLVVAWPVHDENTLGDLIKSLQDMPDEDQNKVWNLIDDWASKEQSESRRGILRECVRRFAFTRRGRNRGINNVTKDRAHSAYKLLTPRDVVIRHQWLFTANWVEESADELEDEEVQDFRKRDERVRALRVEALEEIWRKKGFEGIKALVSISGAAFAIGWHLADGVIEASRAAEFIKQCLAVDETTVIGKIDELIAGFLSRMDAHLRLETTRALLAVMPPSQVCRLLKCSPFQRETWLQVDSQRPEIREQYWREIHPGSLRPDAPEINEVIDRLLEAKRPRAAFRTVHFALEEVETSRLKRLLYEVGTGAFEPAGTYQLDAYHLSSALSILQGRSGITPDEMAGLEFRFIRALEFSEHGLPNLVGQLVKSPSLFMQVLALTFKRSDGGEDPPEWRLDDLEHKEAICSAAYTLLSKIQRIPGTDDNDGAIKTAELKAWVIEVRSLCLKYGRAEIGDQKIGQILAAAPIGDDGVWPCAPVREVLEEIGSPEIATGMGIGVYNARGVCFRGEGGAQERELAAKYRTWSRQLAFEYPYVSNLVEQIATKYDREAAWEDSEAAVRRRLRY